MSTGAGLNRTSIERLAAEAKELGYRTRETDLLDIDNEICLNIEGYGEDWEVYFKRWPATGYLRFDRALLLSDYSATRLPSLADLRSALVGVRKAARELGWQGSEGY